MNFHIDTKLNPTFNLIATRKKKRQIKPNKFFSATGNAVRKISGFYQICEFSFTFSSTAQHAGHCTQSSPSSLSQFPRHKGKGISKKNSSIYLKP